MKSIYLIVLLGYLFFSCSHNNNGSDHNQSEQTQQQKDDHEHEHDSHDHEEQSDNHEGHDHDQEENNHDLDDHNHEHDQEEHNQDVDDHEGHDHDQSKEENSHEHEGHDNEVKKEQIKEELHEHGEDCEHDHSNEEDSNNEDEYGVAEVKPQNFYEVIRTSGEILPAQGDEIAISANHEGNIIFNSASLLIGKVVKANEQLLTISGSKLLHDNIDASFADAKASFNKAELDYSRAKELQKDQIISQKEYQEIELDYQNAKIKYEVIKQNYVKGGQKIVSPVDGFIKNVYVVEGQYVETGQPIINIAKNKRLVIKAEVSQKYLSQLQNIKSANFITTYNNKTFSIEELNGKLISFGKTTDRSTFYTPVYFEIDNHAELFSGTYIEVYLKTNPIADAVVIPKSAILEEYGHHYVYVKHHNEYEKQYVVLGNYDGDKVLIKKGLSAGTEVVTKNAYRLKLANLSNSLPAHAHQH